MCIPAHGVKSIFAHDILRLLGEENRADYLNVTALASANFSAEMELS